MKSEANVIVNGRIDPKEIPDDVYDVGCRILNNCIRKFFALPGVQEEYEEWLKTEEGQLADLPPKERKKRLEAAKK